jgi:uncharacterized protein YjbI with pentapeptide repeats
MADEQYLAILLQGADVWNQWRKDNLAIYPDLSGANLQHARLDGANLSETNLAGAFFGKCQLANVDFTGAILDSARFYRCYLGSSNFSKVSASYVSFFGSDVTAAMFDQSRFSFASFDDGNLEEASLKGADLSYSSCRKTNFRKANLSGANLTCASLVNTELKDASLEGCLVYGVSVWNAKLTGASQTSLVITPEHQSRITVDNLEVAQFISLILNNAHLRDVIGTIGRKAVLLLGSPEGKDVLNSIAIALRQRDLLPIVFDSPRLEEKDFSETVKTLTSISRFLIADLTNSKSASQELQASLPHYAIPCVPIIPKGKSPFPRFAELRTRYHWLLDLVEYDNRETLLRELDERVIHPAITKHAQLTAGKAASV